MTLLEIMAQVVLPAITAGAAGIGGGLVYARRGRAPAHPRSDPPQASLPPKRSEQIPEWARDTWTRERAEREAAEAAAQAAEIDARRDARERITALEKANSNHQAELRVIGNKMSDIREDTKRNADLLGTLRDHIIRHCPHCDESDATPVVRGGAAGAMR